MSDGRVVALRDLSQPDLSQPEGPERNGELVSSGPGWAELEMTDGGAPIPAGTPVRSQTSQAIFLGQVQGSEIHRLRVRVDHSLALQDIAAIQKLWSQEQPG